MDKDVHTKILVMTLQIRDRRAHDLARKLADTRKISMTEAVIQALDGELRRETEKRPLAERIGLIAAALRSQAGTGRGASAGDEIDRTVNPP